MKGNKFVLFTIENQRYGLPIDRTERVFQSVKVTPLANTSSALPIIGVVNAHGTILHIEEIVEQHNEFVFLLDIHAITKQFTDSLCHE